MASLKFRHYATESALKGTGTVDDALNAFDVGTIVFIDDTQKQYIITSKSNNVVTYKIYYGKAAVVGVSRRDATLTLTLSDGSEITVTINNVEHATSSDTADTAKSVAWNNVTGKPTNFVTTDGTQTITGSKIFTNNVSLRGSTSADSITTEDLIVNGAARFVSGLTGNLKGDVVGNVTGNVTGVLTGDATGNAGSATKLQTARNINGTSFNGTASITTAKWGTARTITIADNTNEHTQANNSIDGGANFTLKLPATIKANIIGNASTADSAKSVAWANVTNKPNLVTTDTEQTITGAKIFNNNTIFKNETDVESLTADSLLVTGSARFTNTINGNLKGDVEGNLVGNASTATTAATATEFSANKAVTLTGDVTGSASSKGGWSVATTIANGAVTNAKLANSKITIAGTAVSLGGSIAASTIGAALTTSAPAAYATNAGTATKAAEAEKAIKDSDGNVINTTYIKTVTLASGTNNGTLKLTVGGTTVDNIAVKGLGSAAYTDSESYAAASHIHNYAGSSSAGGNATKADSITTTVGNTNTYRNVFFAYDGDKTKVVYDDDFTYNPSTNTLKIGTGTLTATNYSGTAATATTALSCSGNAATATLANEAKNLQNTTPETKDESFFSKVVTEDADMVSFQTLKGNSVVWNQLVQRAVQQETTLNGLTFYPQENGEVLITGVATEESYVSAAHYLGYNYTSVANHKAFVQIFGDATGTMLLYVTDDRQAMTNLGIVQWGTVAAGSVLYIPKGYDCGQGVRLRFIVNDLTQMFGAGNEPTTYEEFLQRKPKVEDEFAYNEGTIVNNKVEKVVTTGRNLWDEQWEQGTYRNDNGEKYNDLTRIRSKNPMACTPSTTYYAFYGNGNDQLYVYFYDENMGYITSSPYRVDNRTFTSPSNARFFTLGTFGGVTTTYNHDICINLSDPAINGKYFPYEEHTLDLSWVKEIKDTEGVKLFEDGMRSAGTAFDEVGKDKAVKRIEKMVFDGTESFIDYLVQYGSFVIMRDAFVGVGSSIGISNRYVVSKLWEYDTDRTKYDKQIYIDSINNRVWIRDSAFADVNSFKQHLADLYAAGTPLVVYYELAEPIEVELPYGINHTLPVWKDGMMYAESSQSSTPIVCTNAYYTNIRESVKKFIGDADSIYASTSGYNAHGTWNIDISGKASSAITANSAITATSATTATTCTGNAGTATTLQNTRKINGTDFNGSADITTSKWGTARNITISDGTNSGTATSVDGSGAITLNLPGTIKANLSGNASSATKAINDGSGNTITSTYATKTERSNNDITAASLTATKLTLTRAAGNITANIPTWNQDTTGTAAKATADAKGNNIINTYATKAEVAALPKSMVIKGTLDATHALPTSGMTEGDTYIVGASGTYNKIACKVGDFFVRTSNNWLRIPAGDEWEYNENTIKGIKVNNAGHADTADTAVSAGSATSDSNGNNIANTYARINKVYDDSGDYRQFLGKNGDSSSWIRTTTTGIIPYTSGDSSHGNSSLGTPTWYFSKAYIQNIYGYLNGNISGSSTSCSGNSATATKASCLDTGTMTLYAHNSNEINFGGTSTSSEIYVGYRATENRPIPTKFIFGSSNGTATLTAGGFKKSGSSSSYVLTGDGGHAAISGLSVNYASSSGACTGNAATVTNGVYTNTAQTITGYKIFQGSTVKTEGDTVRIPLALTLNTFSDTGHNVAAIGFANEGRGWYKGFFGYERTGPYDTGAFVIGLNNTFDDSSATYNDVKFRFDAKGNLTATKFIGNLDGNATTSSSCSGNSATATKATQDSDGNAINTTYLKRSGGIVTGNVTFNSSVTIDSLTTEDLIVNGAARFVSGLTGDLVGNVTGNLTGTASYATNAGSAASAGTATTSGACSGNATTATKLQTARTIWGQSFDGSRNISGSLTGVTNIAASGSIFSNNYQTNDNTAVAAFIFNKGGDLFGIGVSSGSISNVGFGTTSNSTGTWKSEMMTITNSGNVGIGTTSPTSKLHVAGTGYFTGDTSSAANIIAGGYIKGETVKISSGCTLEYSSTDKCIRFVFN